MFDCYLVKAHSFVIRDRNGVDPEIRESQEELDGGRRSYNQNILYGKENLFSTKEQNRKTIKKCTT